MTLFKLSEMIERNIHDIQQSLVASISVVYGITLILNLRISLSQSVKLLTILFFQNKEHMAFVSVFLHQYYCLQQRTIPNFYYGLIKTIFIIMV